MGEALLSGLLRAASRADASWRRAAARTARRARGSSYGVQAVDTPGAPCPRRHAAPGRQAAGHGAPCWPRSPRTCGRPAGHHRRRRHHDGVHRARLAAGIAGGPRHDQHPGPRRRGHVRDLGRAPTPPRSTSRSPRRSARAGRQGVRVPESQQDAVTALSGSGPAYFFFLVEAMIDAGILLGLPRAVATSSSCRPSSARRRCSRVRRAPGAAARGGHLPGRHHDLGDPDLEDHGVRAAMLSAMEAARDRSRELASGA